MVTFNDFLNNVLHLTPDWIGENASLISGIVQAQCFQQIISTYCEPVIHGTSWYPLFIILTNHIIDQLNCNPNFNICFCHNDPIFVGGSHVERKPDVADVCYRSLEVLERSSVNNLMKDRPNRACFWWTELLLFKLIHKQLLEDQALDALLRDHSSSMSYYWFF